MKTDGNGNKGEEKETRNPPGDDDNNKEGNEKKMRRGRGGRRRRERRERERAEWKENPEQGLAAFLSKHSPRSLYQTKLGLEYGVGGRRSNKSSAIGMPSGASALVALWPMAPNYAVSQSPSECQRCLRLCFSAVPNPGQ